jgi:hypothetical protein
MIVISDTSPILYLVLIGQIELLPQFGPQDYGITGHSQRRRNIGVSEFAGDPRSVIDRDKFSRFAQINQKSASRRSTMKPGGLLLQR